MRGTLEEILTLQRQYSASNTGAMQRRGILIRDILPAEILESSDDISGELGIYGNDLRAQGRDATGRKSQVPWVRLFSQRMSPRPGTGWYLVYLFHPDASGVSLCLSHGSTSPKDGSFQTHSQAEIDQLMVWARGVLETASIAVDGVRSGVSLGNQRLASAYEKTTAISKFYRSGEVPDDATLRSDLVALSSLLGEFYFAQETGHSPTNPVAEKPIFIDRNFAYPSRNAEYEDLAEPGLPITLEDHRERVTAEIVVRRGNKSFRDKALKNFGGRCAISGWKVEAVLEAAHIVPHLGYHTDLADNALLLRADLHTLFDLELLRV